MQFSLSTSNVFFLSLEQSSQTNLSATCHFFNITDLPTSSTITPLGFAPSTTAATAGAAAVTTVQTTIETTVQTTIASAAATSTGAANRYASLESVPGLGVGVVLSFMLFVTGCSAVGAFLL